jgi:cytosine/adenosine deaminase-related metal-dependent hydrolase
MGAADDGEPIHRGSVQSSAADCRRSTIGAIGGARSMLGGVAIMPALVNAHTHLELSYLRGRVPPRTRFLDWIRTSWRRGGSMPMRATRGIFDAARRAMCEARASGTGCSATVSNTLVTRPLLREASMPAHVFYELAEVQRADPARRPRGARESGRGPARTKTFGQPGAARAVLGVAGAVAAIRADLTRIRAR